MSGQRIKNGLVAAAIGAVLGLSGGVFGAFADACAERRVQPAEKVGVFYDYSSGNRAFEESLRGKVMPYSFGLAGILAVAGFAFGACRNR